MRIGPSNCSTKVVNVGEKVSCASHSANKDFRMNSSTSDKADQSMVVSSILEGSGTKIMVTGHGHSGWETNLGIRCCKLSTNPRASLEGPGYSDDPELHAIIDAAQPCGNRKWRSCRPGLFCDGHCKQACKMSTDVLGANGRCKCELDEHCLSGHCDDGYCRIHSAAPERATDDKVPAATDKSGSQVALSERAARWRITVQEEIADSLQPSLCGTCTWWSMDKHAPVTGVPDCYGTWTQLSEYKGHCRQHSGSSKLCAADDSEEDEDVAATRRSREICEKLTRKTNSADFSMVTDGPHGCYKYGSHLYFNAGPEVETGHNRDCLIVNVDLHSQHDGSAKVTTIENKAKCKSMMSATNSIEFHEVTDGPHGCYTYGRRLYYNAGAEVETDHNGDCEIVDVWSTLIKLQSDEDAKAEAVRIQREREQCKSMQSATKSTSFSLVTDGPHGCYKYGQALYFNAGPTIETGHNGDCLLVDLDAFG